MAAKKHHTAAERLMRRSKRNKKTGCLEWQGWRAGLNLYGAISYRGKQYLAHRLSWLTFVGPIPNGARVLHKCDNPLCLEPSHLFLGTQADNVADMLGKGRGRKKMAH